jgi:3D-(3,5/4)-trihydroxycyclohexane-1,2-dione acylhydrolase (decyclizing)
MSATKRMTVSQALIEFLAHQWTVDGDIRERTIPGVFGIFGHGNVAGIGQALKQFNVDQPDLMPYYQVRRAWRQQHAHRRGPGNHQSSARPALAERHVRDARR